MNTENKPVVVARGEGRGMGRMGEGERAVPASRGEVKKSQRRKAQHGEQHQWCRTSVARCDT